MPSLQQVSGTTAGIQYAGTLQLAALGPTSVVFSFSSYVFNALAIATTSKVSADLAAGDERKASATAGAALTIAITAGFICLLILQVAPPRLWLRCAHRPTPDAATARPHSLPGQHPLALQAGSTQACPWRSHGKAGR